MVVQPVTLHLNAQTLQEMDVLTKKTQVTREQLITELVHERAQRERVRAKIIEISKKKHASKRGKAAIKNLEKFRSGLN